MGIVDKLIEGLEMRSDVRELRERNQELELENAALRNELESVGSVDDKQRIKNLEATLRRMIKIARQGANEYCDPTSQAEIRTAEAILENKP